MRPKKLLIERAIANGSIERLNQLLSAAHLLNSEANNLVEEASDVMGNCGLLLGDLKRLHNNFVLAADRYFREFSTLVLNNQAKMDYFQDLDGFDEAFRKWAKVPNGWEPKQDRENHEKELKFLEEIK